MAVKINGEICKFLYEQITDAIDIGLELPVLDSEIVKGLNPTKKLRDYQIDSLRYTDHYVTKMQKNKQLQLLYYMATGSGKTLIMASLILYFYKKGYRTFVFFVNNNNIIEKTKDNFLNKESSKYLFADKIMLDGEEVEINEITTFKDIKDNSINIMFTTIQTLHEKLGLIKEDQMSLEDFEEHKVILLADEAHHLNSETKKKRTKADELDVYSWEYTINQILASNKNSALLEFTATPDFREESIIKKYLDRVIYNYDLLSFRKDGYTKNFDNYQSGNDDIHRLLMAMLMSQYRKKVFAKNKKDVKPVILAKAKTTTERDEFVERFYDFLNNKITEKDIEEIEKTAEGYAREMFNFYKEENISFNDLISELKLDFDKEHFITMDSSMSTEVLQKKNQDVNDLENLNNPYRLIVVVDMLNEGWDVLNLYDIVRLYEERDSKGNKIGKATIQEAQLIGRGVRYFPFVFEENQEAIFNKRKYDDDLTNKNRICETLLFHSKTDSKYLYELKEALKQQGMDIDDKVPFDYILKDSFKMTDMYKHGKIYINDQVKIKSVVEKVPENFKFLFERNYSRDDAQLSLIDNTKVNENKSDTYEKNITVKEFAEKNYNVVYKAMRKSFISFNSLKKYIPGISSNKQFLTNNDYIGNFKLKIISNNQEPTVEEYYDAFQHFFYKLRQKFENWKDTNSGDKSFSEILIKDSIRDTKREKLHPDEYGEGISQNDPRMLEKYKMDLSKYDWFVYNDNYGTTEEKSFVKYFSTVVDKIKEKYQEVYLIRNERNLHIYSFDEGGRFEPDYILVLRNIHSSNSFTQKQIFIEPKGDHLLDVDKWKEDFLKQIEETATLNICNYEINNNYSIHGLPFYNENRGTDEFEGSLIKAVDSENYQDKNIIDE